MVNIDDFVKRLEIILDYYTLNASSFADKIGVQRSSMSHLLSGRNKPSLDFVMKILEVFPDVDLYWILSGKGNFPKNNNNDQDIISKKENTTEIAPPILSEEKITSKNFPDTKNMILKSENNEIEKIVFFYKNGTFKTYIP
ncbi:helix-turn-helix domain-containing protein [Flavobacterium pectinovorum]|uniref:helix-turn-helix domain-containing protein n=1 Tax=Flavobacterium pectinovorum TaxID=29533 RepID=UPI001FACD8AD|nr:helix-turn-helix transcriptional regulator [Flavobacterium pectinovorum]MCI9845724.1 helix-turn-helix transcriptional regulator [Flavobacterium pectinovorum]